MPLLGAVKRYHALLLRLRFPHSGNGSFDSVVIATVLTVVLYGTLVMIVALLHRSFDGVGVAVGVAVDVGVGVAAGVGVAIGPPGPM